MGYGIRSGQPSRKRIDGRWHDVPTGARRSWLTRYWPEARSYTPTGYPYGEGQWNRRRRYEELAAEVYYASARSTGEGHTVLARVVLAVNLQVALSYRYAVEVHRADWSRSVTHYHRLDEARIAYAHMCNIYAGYCAAVAVRRSLAGG
jgi:hypothetical protein